MGDPAINVDKPRAEYRKSTVPRTPGQLPRSLTGGHGSRLYLREVEGFTTEEICEQLGVSESNCWVMLYRARISLRRSLEERWFLKEERQTSGAAASAYRPRARTKSELKTPRCHVPRFGEARHGFNLEATRKQLQTGAV